MRSCALATKAGRLAIFFLVAAFCLPALAGVLYVPVSPTVVAQTADPQGLSRKVSEAPFGNFRTEAHPGGDCANPDNALTCAAPYTFTGHLYDQESGLYYFGARYYDPETGRFLSQDPVAGDALNPPSLHKYLYAYSSPMNYTDPWGEAVGDWWDVRTYKNDVQQAIDTASAFGQGVTVDTAEMGANLVTLGGYGGLKQGMQSGSAYEGPLGGLKAYGRGVRNFTTLGYWDAPDKLQHTKDISGWSDYENLGTHLGEGEYLEATGDLLVGAGKTAGLALGGKQVATGGANLVRNIQSQGAGAALKGVIKGESGVAPIEEPKPLSSREYIPGEVTQAARAPKNAPPTMKPSPDLGPQTIELNLEGIEEQVKVAEGTRRSLGAAASDDPVFQQEKPGIVYKRIDPKTGEPYIGKTKSPQRFKARQKEENRQLGVQHEFEIVGRAKPGSELDVLEETKIRASGGLQKEGGPLANKRHEMIEERYKKSGGTVDDPNKK